MDEEQLLEAIRQNTAGAQANPKQVDKVPGDGEFTPPPGAIPIPRAYSYPMQMGSNKVTEESVRERLDREQAVSDDFALPGAIRDVKRTALTAWYGGNTAVGWGKDLYQKISSGPVDPTWNKEAITDWLNKEGKDISPSLHSYYYGTKNKTEAEMKLADKQAADAFHKQEEAYSPIARFITGMGAGLVDVDLAFGLGASKALQAARLGTVASEVLGQGIAGGALPAYIDRQVNQNSTLEGAILSTVLAGGFGLAGGLLGKAASADALAAVRAGIVDEVGDLAGTTARRAETVSAEQGLGSTRRAAEAEDAAIKEALAPEPAQNSTTPMSGKRPETFNLDDVKLGPDDYQGDGLTGKPNDLSAAGQSGGTYSGPGMRSIRDETSASIIDDARQWRSRSQAAGEWEDPTMNADLSNTSSFFVRQAIRFRDAIGKLGLTSDFDRFMGSGLATAQWLAVNLFESPSGIGRQAITAATMKEVYFKQMKKHFDDYTSAYKDWYSQDAGFGRYDFLVHERGTGVWQARDNFDKEIIGELMSRRFGGQGSTNPRIKRAADAVEKFYAEDLRIGKGDSVTNAIHGYDSIEARPGYIEQRWSGRKMADDLDQHMAKGGRAAWDARIKAYKEALEWHYSIMHPGMRPATRKHIADAVVDSAVASRRGMQRSMLGLLQGDESEYLRTILRRNGVDDTEIDTVIEQLISSRASRNQLPHTRQRTDVDFRAVAPNGIAMMDLLETDISTLLGTRSGRTAGLGAMARFGFTNKTDFEKFSKALFDEQTARGVQIQKGSGVRDAIDNFIDKDRVLKPEDMEAVWYYFSGQRPAHQTGVAAQNMQAMINRIKKTTQLSLMNQLGLTSLAEHGTIAGNVGFQRWWRHMSEDLRSQFGKPDSPLMQELKDFSVFVPEEGMFSGRLMHELDRLDSTNATSFIDSVLNKGVDLQGFLSGFYAVRSNQQRVAMQAVTTKLYEGVRSGKAGFDAARLHDMGFDADFVARTSKHAEFDAQGRLVKLNMDNWDPHDVWLYQNAMTRATNQLVQKAMAGESNWAFQSNGLAQLFWQLKSYPLLAMNKQFIRNTRMMDSEMVQTYLWGIAMAGAIYAARETVNGRGSELTPERIARGAVNYSSLAGWAPMIVDPIFGAIGSDYSLSGYSSRGVGSVLSLPASFSTIDRLLQLPGVPLGILGEVTGMGELSNSQIRAMQTIPLIGNAYGINALFNYMKD